MKWALPVVALAAVAVAGCGGGGGGGGTPLSKAEFIKRGDAICAKYRAKNEKLQAKAPVKSPTDPSATDEQVKASGPILATLAANLRAAHGEFTQLTPPTDIANDWNNTLDDIDQLASKLDTAAGAAKRVDRQRVVNEYNGILLLNHRISTFETDYGFKVCGNQG